MDDYVGTGGEAVLTEAGSDELIIAQVRSGKSAALEVRSMTVISASQGRSPWPRPTIPAMQTTLSLILLQR
jgi:hypothetical protein